MEEVARLPRPASVPDLPPPAAVISATRAALEKLFADPEVSRRVAIANTTVRLSFRDAGDRGLTLMLDREPAEVLDAGGSSAEEVRLVIPSAELHRFWSGEGHPAISILSGDAAYQGPVRKALRVFPILRKGSDAYFAALGDRWHPPAETEGAR